MGQNSPRPPVHPTRRDTTHGTPPQKQPFFILKEHRASVMAVAQKITPA
ncbi:MAG: hypothetical protein AAFY20_00855 [Cyanobacteria bacterium J06639_14]